MMRTKFKIEFRYDNGYSLIEVVIATMLLAIAGTALIVGLLSSRVVQAKTAAKATYLNTFAEVAEELNQQPYANCYGVTNPYPKTVSMKTTDLIKVQVLRDNVWVDCFSLTGSDNPIQLISLQMYFNNQLLEEKFVKFP